MTRPVADVPAPPPRRWGFLALVVAVALVDVWWRGHTIGPTIRDRLGFAPYPVVGGRAEPIDCDEAAYAYIGAGIDRGLVLYRDLSENKPPLGYWLYALATGLGGATETTIRLMPIVPVVLTLVLVGWAADRLRGGWVAPGLAMVGFVLLSTDPFLYGNGANMEHFLNLFAVAALAAVVRAWDEPAAGRARFAWVTLAGGCVALATLVKQVAAIDGPVFAAALALASIRGEPGRSRWRGLAADWSALIVGFAIPVGLAAGVVVAQGAGRDAWADVVEYGSALATIKVPEAHAPARLVRWFTGNADPAGHLPPPFGRTDYLVWWGSGSWPLWLAAVAAVVWLLARRGDRARRTHRPATRGPDRVVAAWTLAAWVQVALPGLFWQHYYLLPTPGVALTVALATTDALRGTGAAVRSRRFGRALGSGLVGLALLAAVGQTVRLQVRDYLLVPAEQLTVRYKGGGQWVALRDLGAAIRRRVDGAWADQPPPDLYIWGWQSPLHFYAGLDSPTRHFFADPLLEDYANGHHGDDPRVRPRVDRIASDLAARPPGLILVARTPFDALRRFLRERGYRRSAVTGLSISSPDAIGLWVDPAHFAAFEHPAARSPAPTR